MSGYLGCALKYSSTRGSPQLTRRAERLQARPDRNSSPETSAGRGRRSCPRARRTAACSRATAGASRSTWSRSAHRDSTRCHCTCRSCPSPRRRRTADRRQRSGGVFFKTSPSRDEQSAGAARAVVRAKNRQRPRAEVRVGVRCRPACPSASRTAPAAISSGRKRARTLRIGSCSPFAVDVRPRLNDHRIRPALHLGDDPIGRPSRAPAFPAFAGRGRSAPSRMSGRCSRRTLSGAGYRPQPRGKPRQSLDKTRSRMSELEFSFCGCRLLMSLYVVVAEPPSRPEQSHGLVFDGIAEVRRL